MQYECPSCQCFKITGPATEGTYPFEYAECTDDTYPYTYADNSVTFNEVKYICAIPGTINGLSVTVEPCDIPPCNCVKANPTCIPNAYCYTVTLDGGFSASFKYVVPDDGFGINRLKTETLTSSPGGSSINVCAREGSIVVISGAITISSPGASCTTDDDCNFFP